MKRRQSSGGVVALGSLVVVGICAVCITRTAVSQPPGGGPMPPPEVAFVTIQQEQVTLTTELPGRTTAHLVAEVRPQVSGIVQKRLFTEGSLVKEGEVLYEIDPAPYQAAYDLAVAALARAEASVPPIELLAARQKDLVPTGAVSQQEYDEVLAHLKQAQAEIAYSKAAIESARINLEYTHVKAPISGRIGRSNVTVGALATAHQGPPFAVIQQLDPIYVDVTQSTAQLRLLQSRLNSGLLKRDEENVNKVRLILDDGTEYPHEGALQFRDVTVDPTTGSVILRVLFPNPDEELLPGMFVRAMVTEGINDQAILVSQQAVSRTPKGDPLVLTVSAEGKAEQRLITLERDIGNRWLIADGLAVGDKVIVEGAQRVRPGSPVRAVPWEQEPARQPVSQASGDPSAEAK